MTHSSVSRLRSVCFLLALAVMARPAGAGLATSPSQEIVATPGDTVWSIAGGDMNQDGYNDMAVPTPRTNPGYPGHASGVSPTPHLQVDLSADRQNFPPEC